MFPKSVGEFSYADLKAARKFPWFSQLYGQVLPPKFRQFEQFAPAMCPTSGLNDEAWLSSRQVKVIESGISIGLQDATVVFQMSRRMLAFAIRRVGEPDRR